MADVSRASQMTSPHAFGHPALLYRDETEYLDGTVPFVHAGIAAGDPVAVAVPGPNLKLIVEALGARATEVLLLDMSDAGRNPGRIIPNVLLAFAETHAPRPVWIIGEPIWPGRSKAEYPACAQHEALINLAFAGRPATILCPYDTSRLGPDEVRDAYRTHPVMIDSAGQRPSPDYAPQQVIDGYNLALPIPSGRLVNAFLFNGDNLAQVRSYAAGVAARLGVSPDRVPDVELAVAELADNSVRHGGGRGVLEMWRTDEHLVCQVRDTGTIADPLVGRRPGGGLGLLAVNRVADLVRCHTVADRTTFRLYFRLTAP